MKYASISRSMVSTAVMIASAPSKNHFNDHVKLKIKEMCVESILLEASKACGHYNSDLRAIRERHLDGVSGRKWTSISQHMMGGRR